LPPDSSSLEDGNRNPIDAASVFVRASRACGISRIHSATGGNDHG
jgi:hypothetical protein